MTSWNQLSESIRANRQPCLVLGSDGKPDKNCKIVASQAHHVLFSRDVRFKDWLNDPINAQPACENCNAGTKMADNWMNSRIWFENLIRDPKKRKYLYGWLRRAPAKKKIGDPWEYYARQLGMES